MHGLKCSLKNLHNHTGMSRLRRETKERTSVATTISTAHVGEIRSIARYLVLFLHSPSHDE